jgi:hypothetical protein
MGRLTRGELISEGQLLAGRDDMATQAANWLQRWLDAVAASWPWPILHTEAVDIALTANATSLSVGAGSGGITDEILKIQDNVWMYDSTRTFRRRLRIRHQLSAPADRIGPTTNLGAPSSIRLFIDRTTLGKWVAYFEPTPDKAYMLSIPYLRVPAKLTLDADVPWFPNDETMVQAIAFKVSEFHNGKDHPVTQAFQQNLAGLIANDRIRFGAIVGVNDGMPLDPAVFRKRTL